VVLQRETLSFFSEHAPFGLTGLFELLEDGCHFVFAATQLCYQYQVVILRCTQFSIVSGVIVICICGFHSAGSPYLFLAVQTSSLLMFAIKIKDQSRIAYENFSLNQQHMKSPIVTSG
jgi:hypothetical protein